MNGRQLAVLAALGIAACSTAPPTQEPNSREQHAPAAGNWIPPGSSVAIAVGRFEPAIAIDGDARQGQYAAIGALEGQAQCARGFQGGGFIGGALFLICAPFGSLEGASKAMERAATPETAERARDRMASTSENLYVSAMLEAAVERIARPYEMAEAILREEGPSSATEEPLYATADYVAEIRISRIVASTPASTALPYRFVINADGRLIRTAGNVVVDRFSSRVATGARTAEEWAANHNDLLSRELGAALERIASNYLSEWVIVYRGEPLREALQLQTSSDLSDPVPAYALRPLNPALRRAAPLSRDILVPTQVASVTPTLTWEALPRSISPSLFAGPTPRAKNMTYQVRIFEGAWRELRSSNGKSHRVLRAARVVRAQDGLAEPRLSVQEPLEACKQYFWTVRASFDLEGRRRATEWSGAYATRLGEMSPDYLRRPTSPLVVHPSVTQSMYFFPFKTPCGAATPARRRDKRT